MRDIWRWTVLGLCLAPAALAQEAGPRKAAPCRAPEYRQFDFWVGRWQVTTPDGQVVGTNLITREHGGCVIRESWTGARGMTGTSLNIYTAATRRWHQSWVDSTGSLLLLDGEFRDGAMRLAGETFGPGGRQRSRITWTPGERVRQLWETSSDGGKTWETIFDGMYQRLGE